MRKAKLAVLFPGIGYTCDRPLLSGSARLAAASGYEVVKVSYGGFPAGILGDGRKMEEAFDLALKQTEESLAEVDFSDREALFISKSIGTAVAAAYARKHGLKVRSVSFTPVEQTFLFAQGEGIQFHGTADPWAKDTDKIRAGCAKIGQELIVINGANHSLETGDAETDRVILSQVMAKVKEFLGYSFWGWETADVPPIREEFEAVKDPRALYDLLSGLWCADTCAPRMRALWTPENKTLGQCSITAFLAQDIFGGEVYGILRPDGNYHCYNVVGDCAFDLTSEQFGDERLCYEGNPLQHRETHFSKTEKKERYERLKEDLVRRLGAAWEP